MTKLKINKKELEKKILIEKQKGTSDKEIGKLYGVNLKYIENLITKTEGVNISKLKPTKKIKTFYPKDFKEETTTFWSFKQRGNWATHSGEYRGNWSPYVPRNVILKYSKPGEVVLDYFCGAGTTAIECKLLGRRCIALDINEKAIELAKEKLNFKINENLELPFEGKNRLEIYEPELLVRDARDLSFLKDNSIDLICAHPPYANIIHYTHNKEGDLSLLNIEEFLNEMQKVAKESLRVLKPARHCAILIGDTRKKKYIIPLGFKLLNVFLSAGFNLKEVVIKQQHNCKTTGFWYNNSIKYNFLLLAHEYLFIFEKPTHQYEKIKEKTAQYSIFNSKLQKSSFIPRINRLETTTIWKFQEESFEESVNSNVIKRYSTSNDYLMYVLCVNNKSVKIDKVVEYEDKQRSCLLFIKSYFNNTKITQQDINAYLTKIKQFIEENLCYINNKGFVVIQTQDIRINGYITPLAKMLTDILSNYNKLKLKEIVIAVSESDKEKYQQTSEYLKIVHQYLIVYEVIK